MPQGVTSRSQSNGLPRPTRQSEETDDSRERQSQKDRDYEKLYAEEIAKLPPEEQTKFRLAGLDLPDSPDYKVAPKADDRDKENSPTEVGEEGGFEEGQAVQIETLDPLGALLEKEEEKEFAFLSRSLRGLTPSEVLTHFLTFVFAANDRHPIQSLRRFTAAVYQIRPDLLSTNRQKLLAKALGYTKAGFSKTVKSNNVKIGVWGRLQKSQADCDKFSAAHKGKNHRRRTKPKKVEAQQSELWGQRTLQPDLFTTLPEPQRKRKAA
jgi:hypothetical protein